MTTSLYGIEITTSPFVPEKSEYAVDDWQERLEAMTSHHIALDLLPLTELQPSAWRMTDPRTGRERIVCHPNVLEAFKALMT